MRRARRIRVAQRNDFQNAPLALHPHSASIPPMLSRWTCGALLTLSSLACLRDLPDLPPDPEGGSLTGRVIVRDRRTSELVGLPGASVGIDGTSQFVSTDERGFFQLQRTPLGSLVLHITRPYQGPTIPRAGRRLDAVQVLVSGQAIDLGDLELFGAGDVQGAVRVLDDPALGPGALVIAAQTAYKSIVGLDRTFTLPNMPEGAFDVVAFLPSFDPATHGAVAITANATVRLRDLTFAGPPLPQVTVRGKLTLRDGKDPSVATITFTDELDPTAERTARPSANGDFELTLPPRSYRARFAAPGYRDVRLFGVAATPAGALGLVPIYLSPEVPDDFDGDGIPDATDPDLDNDGCINADDLFPKDTYACRDADGDGLDDDLDLDDDDDTLADAEEITTGLDTWVTNPLDPDTDADTLRDAADNCPTFPNPDQADADDDGRGDACATATSTTVPPTPTARITVFPSLVMPGDRLRFTGPNLADVTAIHVGDLALEALTATTGGLLATVPAAIAPGDTRLTTPRGDLAGPRLSVLTIRPIPGVGCPNGERITFSQLNVDSIGRDIIKVSCETVRRTYARADGTLLAEQSLPALPANTVLYGVYDDAVLAVNEQTRLLRHVNCQLDLGVVREATPPVGLRVVSWASDRYATLLRSPVDGRWISQLFCLPLLLPADLGGVTAIGARGPMIRDPNFVIKHATRGYANLLVSGKAIALDATFDGKTGSPEAIIPSLDGSVLSLGGDMGVSRAYPFSNRAVQRVPNYNPWPDSSYLLDPTGQWLLVVEPRTPTILFDDYQPVVTIIDLGQYTIARRPTEAEIGANFRPFADDDGVSDLGGFGQSVIGLDIATGSRDAGVNPDANVAMCGDGRYDPSEECEPGVSGAPRCRDGYCSSCRCIPNVCGDGQRTGSEGCEFNRDCSAGAVCRSCQCALAEAAVTYSDTMGDVPSTPQGYAIDYIEFQVDGAGQDRITFGYRNVGGSQPDMLSQVCLVIQVAQGQQQRLCLQGMRLMPLEVAFTGVDGQTRVLRPDEANLGSGLDSISIHYPASLLGLRIEAGLTFTVESLYGGVRTDVLPDVGSATFDAVVGR